MDGTRCEDAVSVVVYVSGNRLGWASYEERGEPWECGLAERINGARADGSGQYTLPHLRYTLRAMPGPLRESRYACLPPQLWLVLQC